MRFAVTLFFAIAFGWLAGGLLQDRAESSSPETSIPFEKERVTALDIAPLVSTDTLRDFSEGAEDLSIDRLALWLLDADIGEIALLFNEFSSREKYDHRAMRLILNAWARRDPDAVIAATRNDRFSMDALRAVATQHPARAFEEALAHFEKTADKHPLTEILDLLGQYHPAWVQAHFGDLEDWMKEYALMNFRPDLGASSPQELVDFLRSNGKMIRSDLLIAFGKENPVEALRLAEELKQTGGHAARKLPDELLEALAAESPALLAVLLAETKSPVTKNKIELLQFQQAIELDPEGALESLNDLPNGFSRDDKMAALSRHFLESDPNKSIEVFARLLAESKGGFDRGTNVITKNGNITYGSSESPPRKLLEELVATRPEVLMEATLPRDGDSTRRYLAVAGEWVKQDQEGFADWTSRQEDPEVFRESAKLLSNRLIQDLKLPEAMTWAESIGTQEGENTFYVSNVYQAWLSRDPEAARTWREASTLDEKVQTRLDHIEAENP